MPPKRKNIATITFKRFQCIKFEDKEFESLAYMKPPAEEALARQAPEIATGVFLVDAVITKLFITEVFLSFVSLQLCLSLELLHSSQCVFHPPPLCMKYMQYVARPVRSWEVRLNLAHQSLLGLSRQLALKNKPP